MRLLLAAITGLLLATTLPVAGQDSTRPQQLTDLLALAAVHNPASIDSLILDMTHAGERLVAVGAYGTVLLSDDEGASWRQASVPVQVTLTAVSFPTPDKGWAVGHDAVILHSADAGESWHKQLDGWATGDLLLTAAEARMEQLGGDPDADMVLVDMADMALEEAERELEIGPNRPLLDVWFRDELYGVAVGAFNYYFVTEDGGRTWQDRSLTLPNPEALHLYTIAAIGGNTLLIAGEFGLLLRSTDGGHLWTAVDLGYEGTLFSVSGQNGSAWVAGLRGNAFYSADSGENWQAVSLGVETTLLEACSLSADTAVFAGLGGTLLRFNKTEQLVEAVGRPGGGHISSIMMLPDSVLIAGVTGIQRISLEGEQQPVSYRNGG
ncbi:MAG: YCF48-related protein [Halioglobus sp.]